MRVPERERARLTELKIICSTLVSLEREDVLSLTPRHGPQHDSVPGDSRCVCVCVCVCVASPTDLDVLNHFRSALEGVLEARQHLWQQHKQNACTDIERDTHAQAQKTRQESE